MLVDNLPRPKKVETLERCKGVYRNYGYSVEKDFPGEYYFMHNPETGECVRLYYRVGPNGHGVEEYHKW